MRSIIKLHDGFFQGLQSALGGAALGLLARLTFASVLLFYFWNSALTKVIMRGQADGPLDYLTVHGNALAQIAPKTFEAAGYDASAMSPLVWAVAYAGTYAEFALPLLIVIGLFTRLASLGMLGFIAVMTWVDITGHDADAATIGATFDRVQDSAILDQRLLWAFPLIYLVVRGAGAFSVDGVLRWLRG